MSTLKQELLDKVVSMVDNLMAEEILMDEGLSQYDTIKEILNRRKPPISVHAVEMAFSHRLNYHV